MPTGETKPRSERSRVSASDPCSIAGGRAAVRRGRGTTQRRHRSRRGHDGGHRACARGSVSTASNSTTTPPRFFREVFSVTAAPARIHRGVELRGCPVKSWSETRVISSFKRFIRHVKLFAKSHVSRRVKTRLYKKGLFCCCCCCCWGLPN